MKQKNIWIILLILGIIPFAYVLCYGIYKSLTSDMDVFKTFGDAVVVYSSIIWPLYIVGLFLIVFSIIKLKRSN